MEQFSKEFVATFLYFYLLIHENVIWKCQKALLYSRRSLSPFLFIHKARNPVTGGRLTGLTYLVYNKSLLAITHLLTLS